MVVDLDNTVSLLTFPKASNGLTSGARIVYSIKQLSLSDGDDDDDTRRSSPTSRSPPRKTARLAGDEDYSASVTRARDKGKGKAQPTSQTQTKGAVGKPVMMTVIDAPDMTIPESYLDSLLPKIHKAITAVLSRREPIPMPSSYESIYQATRTVVNIAGKGQWIYDKLRFELRTTADAIARELISFQPDDAVDWLARLVDVASWYDRSMGRLENLLTYLDRVYLVKRGGEQRVRPLAMSLFRMRVFEHVIIIGKMNEAIKVWAAFERTTQKTHPKRAAVISFANIIHGYSLFTPNFLTPYLAETRSFYEGEAVRRTGEDGRGKTPRGNMANSKRDPDEDRKTAAFLLYCDKQLDEEKQRTEVVLAEFDWCWPDVTRTIERALLAGRLPWLSKGIVTPVVKREVDGLVRMYDIFGRVDGLKLLCDAFKVQVQVMVTQIVTDEARDDEMVDRLLELKGFIDGAIPVAFVDIQVIPTRTSSSETRPARAKEANDVLNQPPTSRASSSASGLPSTSQSKSTTATAMVEPTRTPNKEFIYAVSDAFAAGFRARRRVPAEMIAKYIDRAMRRGQREASDEEFMQLLDRLLALYRFTPDKDVFRTFYHRALAKRLLLHRSASDDFEKAVLKKLKEQYDPEFSMGDHMFRDLALARDIMAEFHARPDVRGTDAERLIVMVLQRSFWPFSARKGADVLLPPWMQDDLSRYAEFYRGAHKGHKLDFDHSLGTVSLRARFAGGEKELSVSLYQAVVLMLFNELDEIPFKEVEELTQMEDGDLRRTLQSLACGAKRVLKKRPAGRDVHDGDVFVFNAAFTDSKPKVHINSIQSKETPEETKRTHSAIEGDRKHYLDAAIVRVMKARKTVPHQQLITATIDAVKAHFAPEVRTIKERIEQLIEQEYLRRDEEADNVYVYVA